LKFWNLQAAHSSGYQTTIVNTLMQTKTTERIQ